MKRRKAKLEYRGVENLRCSERYLSSCNVRIAPPMPFSAFRLRCSLAVFNFKAPTLSAPVIKRVHHLCSDPASASSFVILSLI